MLKSVLRTDRGDPCGRPSRKKPPAVPLMSPFPHDICKHICAFGDGGSKQPPYGEDCTFGNGRPQGSPLQQNTRVFYKKTGTCKICKRQIATTECGFFATNVSHDPCAAVMGAKAANIKSVRFGFNVI